MATAWRRLLTRNVDAPWLFETFFIAAVASFLGIRWFLAVTGYPRLGSNGIHIAHMLWGGLLMLLAVLLLLGYVNRSLRQVAAVIAGLGFGTFIDEIGKFVTSDNDYFFRPAVALVYVVFVGAFLVARVVVGRRRISHDEAIANALDQLAGLSGEALQPDDRTRISGLLALADPDDSGTQLLRRFLAERPRTSEHPTPLERVRDWLGATYDRLMAHRLAERALAAFVAAYAVLAVIGVGLVVATAASDSSPSGPSIGALAQLVSTVCGAAIVGIGVVAFPKSRVNGYRWMQRGVLVWILVTQVFVFYSSQLAGLTGLAIDVTAYLALHFTITREEDAGRNRPTGSTIY